MGCDIHLYCEVRREGKWKPLSKTVPNSFDDGGGTDWHEPYNGRDYDVFAILANVRNGTGFAGSDTGKGFVPICEQRGLPGDLSEELVAAQEGIDEEATYLWFGDHSHSHMNLYELLDYDYTQVTTKTGIVSWPQYVRWMFLGGESNTRNHYPEGYCSGVGGPGITVEPHSVTFKEKYDRLTGEEKRDLAWSDGATKGGLGTELCKDYCTVMWEVDYAHVMKEFTSQVTLMLLGELNKMRVQDAMVDAQDLRIVFGFDS